MIAKTLWIIFLTLKPVGHDATVFAVPALEVKP